jgi:GNAT superfamily N-acetyltransferase
MQLGITSALGRRWLKILISLSSSWPWFCTTDLQEEVMEACIEPAKEKDLPRMAELLGHLFAQEADFKPNPRAQLRGLRRILADPEQGQLLVAREDGEVLGMVSLLWTVSTALGDPVAWLEDMVVDPELRGRGLGKGLLNAAIALCRDRGIQRITLLTDGDNIPAQTLYRSCGFQPSAMVPLRLRL